MDQADRHKRPLLAILIDADNLSSTHAEPILREVTSIGEPALRNVVNRFILIENLDRDTPEGAQGRETPKKRWA